MNIKSLLYAGSLLFAFVVFQTACKQPSPFGSELLEEEYADYDFTDTITVECSLVREDSIATSDKVAAAAHFLCGEINDPVFGKYRSDIYSLLLPEDLNPNFNTDSITFDSIVMYLNYAPAGIYGDTLQTQTLRVIRLAENMGNATTYYSNSTLQEGAELGRVEGFRPKPTKSDSLFEGNEGAFLRIRLDDAFGQELLALDSLSWVTDSAFYSKLRGLKIVCSSNGAQPGAMMAFNLNNNLLSRVALFYTEKGDTSQSRFDFYFRNVNKFTHFDHNYTGSEVAPYIGNTITGDRMYLHGMQGVKLKVSFPYVNKLDKIAVNKAQLVLTVADENTFLPPADQLLFTELVGDSVFNFTSDVLYTFGATGSGALKGFGGFPEKEFINGNVLFTRYRMTLSEKFQHMIDDDAAPDLNNRTVYINVYPRVRSAERTVVFGPKSSTFPAKLELKYTRVQ
jgi:hypothetical protein